MINEEETNLPKITKSEVQEWENKFRQMVSPMVQFDTNNETGEKSFKLYKGISGIEAMWMGTIPLKSDNYIKWSFSLQNEAFIEAKFSLDEETSKLIPKIYSFYTMWKTEWEKSLTLPQSMEKNTEMETGGEMIKEAKSRINKERTRNFIIAEHSERMQRLAGVYHNKKKK